MSLTFLTGGARSGKSARALRLAQLSGRDVTFIATGHAGDDEMVDRIRRHQAERPASWSTVEAPVDLTAPIAGLAPGRVGIIDCLSLWISNLMERGDTAEQITAAAQAAAEDCARSANDWFVVSNEVGMGLVPMHPVGRAYRDHLGRANAIFAQQAQLAQFMVAGLAITLEKENS